jgi:hypothetical protein
VIYFVGLTVVGTFIVVAFVISSFLGSFRKEFHHAVLKKTQLARSGFFAAFAVMDFEQTGKVAKRVLYHFYDRITATGSQEFQIRHNKKRFVDKASTLSKFVDAMEDHIFEINKIQQMQKLGHFDNETLIQQLAVRSLKTAHTRKKSLFGDRRASTSVTNSATGTGKVEVDLSAEGNIRRRLFVFISQPWFGKVITLLVLLQTGVLTFYGLIGNTYLDFFNLFFVIVFFVEIVIKMIAYGPAAVSYVFVNQFLIVFSIYRQLCTTLKALST